MEVFVMITLWEFPGGLVVKTLCFYCSAPGSISSRELRSHELHVMDKKNKETFGKNNQKRSGLSHPRKGQTGGPFRKDQSQPYMGMPLLPSLSIRFPPLPCRPLFTKMKSLLSGPSSPIILPTAPRLPSSL